MFGGINPVRRRDQTCDDVARQRVGDDEIALALKLLALLAVMRC